MRYVSSKRAEGRGAEGWQELALLYCQYLEGRNQGHLSRLIHDELFGAAKVEENEHARGEIERAIFGQSCSVPS